MLPLLGCVAGAAIGGMMGLAGATIAAGAAVDLLGAGAGAADAGATRHDAGGVWAALASGMALCVMGAGAMLSFVAAGVPHELSQELDSGDVLVRRHPMRDVRIPRRRLRHVRVVGRTNRSGRLVLVVVLAVRGRRIPVLVDSGRDMEALLARVLGHAEGLAEVLRIPLVLEGWARDPGHDPGRGQPMVDQSAYD